MQLAIKNAMLNQENCQAEENRTSIRASCIWQLKFIILSNDICMLLRAEPHRRQD